MPRQAPDHAYFSTLIWQIADLLRGPYRPPQYERVMLPMTVLRRFDCVLAPTKARVLAEYERRKGGRLRGEALDSVLNRAAGQRFHNRSPLDFEKLQGDPDHIAQHLVSYIQGFSADVRRIFVEYFEFEAEIEKMRESHILYRKRQQGEVRREHEQQGFAGRFGAGLPRVNDGSLLFLQHMIAKFEPVCPEEHKHGSRLAIVFSGSPLFTGGAGSGESSIRRWIIENDWLEAVIALPEQMFYNTGIGTYVWIVTNRKEKRRRGRIQLLDARDLWTPGGSAESRRSLGDKRRHLAAGQIDEIVRLYGRFRDGGRSKIFGNTDFGYTRVTVERPLRLRYQMTFDDKARFLDACPFLLDDVQAIDKSLGREPMHDWNAVWERIADLLHARGSRWKKAEQRLFRDVFTHKDPEAEPIARGGREQGFEPDPGLRDFENIPLADDVDGYFEREVRPHVPDAWMDRSKDRVGYEINFNRYFYEYTPPRPLEEIDADLKQAEEEIVRLLRGVVG